jgi:transforming growth factor-beta-induced protein
VVVNKQPGEVIVFSSAQGARTTQTKGDMRFAGGLLHIVDNLLIPPTRLEPTLEAFSLDSFFGALHAAELMPTLAEEQNVTIFAPRDEAPALVGGTLSRLDTDALARVVGYHVIPGRVISSAELSNGTRLDTRAGGGAALTVRRSGNDLYVDSSRVVQPDILIANGVLHVVENVLNPDAGGVVPNPEVATQGPVWPVSEADSVFTSAIPCSVDCPTTTATETSSSSRTTATADPTGGSPDRDDNAGGRFGVSAAGVAVGVIGAVFMAVA